MKKVFLWVGIFLASTEGIIAQVGINTVDPKAQLDITSTSSADPEITDGILIPRIDKFPDQTPTADQEGMLVYLQTDKVNFPKGFYFWNSSEASWLPITGKTTVDFYKEGTTLPAENTTDGIYRTGNVGIGEESPEVKLKIVLGPEADHITRTGLEVDNSSSTPTYVTYGILNNNWTATDSRKYGIKTNVSSAGKGVHYGIYNEVYQSSVEDMYGIFNKVGRTYGVAKNHYGIYSEIGTPTGAGMVYGIYSKAEGDNYRRVYAGYFAGRLGIGLTPEKEYVFPDSKGNRNEILALGDEDFLVWRSPNVRSYTATGSAIGNFVIPQETYTLCINNAVSSITIPEASLNKGRIIVLLGWNGISSKTLNFLGGDDIWDVSTASPVNSISSGQQLTIQSAGTRWVVLNKNF